MKYSVEAKGTSKFEREIKKKPSELIVLIFLVKSVHHTVLLIKF